MVARKVLPCALKIKNHTEHENVALQPISIKIEIILQEAEQINKMINLINVY
jgi:hypothetical protein